MRTPQNIDPSISAFLNALLREFKGWTIRTDVLAGVERELLSIPLASQDSKVFIRLRNNSEAGRYAFLPPLLLGQEPASARAIDLMTFAALLLHNSEIVGEVSPNARSLFLTRLADSIHSLDAAVDNRKSDLERIFRTPHSFAESEQALLLGHPVHPTPKSHDEWSDEEVRLFAPEFAAAFPLRWMLVHRHCLDAAGTDDLPLRQALNDLITDDPDFPEQALTLIENAPEHLPMPMHPWQALQVLSQPEIRAMLAKGDLIDLGVMGSPFLPTSSVRSLYGAHAPFMLKFSLSVRLTNSVRVLLPKEWERGKQIHRLFATPLWQEISARFPSFHILSEPVHMALRSADGQTIRETAVLFRQNPFRGAAAENTEVMASLCQDHPLGGKSRLAEIVTRISQREDCDGPSAAERWFARFLEIVLRPFLQIQADYGLLFGAHQQNTILVLENDYPAAVYYRDCQGTGHSSSAHATLKAFLPEIGGEAQNTVDDELGHRLFGYYLIVNNLFNVIASLAQTQAVTEARLFAQLRRFLIDLRDAGLRDPGFVNKLIDEPLIWSKGNFLTCLRDINESHEGEDQLAVYVPMANPIASAQNIEQRDTTFPESNLAKTG